MTVQGSILPLESSARILAWQTVFWQLSELLGPGGYRGLQTAAPISSYRGIVGGIWCSRLPKLPDGVNNKPQNASQGVAARVTRSVFKKGRKVVWAMLGPLPSVTSQSYPGRVSGRQFGIMQAATCVDEKIL